MAIFNEALSMVLSHEGGYNNIKEDKGGATNFGISLAFYRNNIDKNATSASIKSLKKEEAETIYFDYFWLKNNYCELSNQKLANKVFDMAVNLGSMVANKFLQQAYNALNINQLVVDGILGEESVSNINSCTKEQNTLLLEYLRILQKHYYLEIVKHRVDQAKFLNGWLNRANI
jgi:lysozyme family protein